MSDQTAATSGHDAPNAAATTPITVEQAAERLGVSVTTVKRRIRSGLLRAEQASRPQGTVWLVYLPAAATSGHNRPDERPPAASVAATAPATSPAADAMMSLIQTTIGTVLLPIVAELAATRQDGTRKDDIIREQAETIGTLRADLANAQATVSTLEARTAVQTVEPPTESTVTWRWLWARWWPLAATLVVATTLAVVLLMVPR